MVLLYIRTLLHSAAYELSLTDLYVYIRMYGVHVVGTVYLYISSQLCFCVHSTIVSAPHWQG